MCLYKRLRAALKAQRTDLEPAVAAGGFFFCDKMGECALCSLEGGVGGIFTRSLRWRKQLKTFATNARLSSPSFSMSAPRPLTQRRSLSMTFSMYRAPQDAFGDIRVFSMS